LFLWPNIHAVQRDENSVGGNKNDTIFLKFSTEFQFIMEPDLPA